MNNMKIIDTHQHVFWHGRDDVGLVADLDENNIDLAWLLSWEIHPLEHASSYQPVLNPEHVRGDGTNAGIPFRDLVRAKRAYPDRFVLGYCPHPLWDNPTGLLESAYRIHGARVCGEWKFRIPFDDPRCLEIFRCAGRLGMPVVLHLDVPYLAGEDGKPVYQPKWYGGTVANLERALQACPETNFIGHAPGFWREISGDADQAGTSYPQGPVTEGGRLYRLLDTYENLYADMSAGSGLKALSRDPEHAVRFLNRYADRILYARDYYGSDWMDFLKSISLEEGAMEKICYKNAEKLGQNW